MKLQLLVVGKPKDPAATQLHDRYADRLNRFGVGYRCDWVPDVAAGGRFTDDHAREREARWLLDRLPARGTVVALDPSGRSLSSPELARRLSRWATPGVTFVLGGPLGLHDTIRRRADWVWSLSQLTLPHELARVVVAEQLYRALTLIRNVPYHK